jgi:hypothetical protein
LGAFVFVDTLLDKHWLESGITENDTGSEQAVQDSDCYLDNSLALADFEASKRFFIVSNNWLPSCAGLERQLSALRSGRRLASPLIKGFLIR